MFKRKKNKVDNTDALISGLLSKLTPDLEAGINYKMDLAAKIFAGMKAKGWNQTEFAKQMNVSNSVITKWLSGYNNFEADTLFAIQNKLGICLLNLDKIGSKGTIIASNNIVNVFNFNEPIKGLEEMTSEENVFSSHFKPGLTIQVVEYQDHLSN